MIMIVISEIVPNVADIDIVLKLRTLRRGLFAQCFSGAV